jgi:hypothetical protein
LEVILINRISPPDFELFSKTLKQVELENYFSSFPFYLLVSAWLVPVVLFRGLNKVLSTIISKQRCISLKA